MRVLLTSGKSHQHPRISSPLTDIMLLAATVRTVMACHENSSQKELGAYCFHLPYHGSEENYYTRIQRHNLLSPSACV